MIAPPNNPTSIWNLIVFARTCHHNTLEQTLWWNHRHIKNEKKYDTKFNIQTYARYKQNANSAR